MTAKAASSFTSLHFLPFSLDRIVVLFVFIHFEMFFNGVMALKLETNRALKLQEEYNKHLRPNHKGRQTSKLFKPSGADLGFSRGEGGG